ncbi:hypothetical protein A1Q1_02156 [Trichosporon asahii var. asahii CBS 2479]|uniref:Uncharacterized protein n=1 Tax=Trichosporon asahii var. asahii (strain ATCC 90039 / CBS 2479 / JCM 2466 / KCTC 7840 / NBRC 103889/ NCYC 2677 / UAMH 7654) TaxID=1186058 RepID=J5T2H3_TRIAS|nr:hypothetical protein A1Q1_02156 [Trichosporon asahii var. asahii CBS 2479]EJT48821.1 hypothetical protein A1Q1_02156 [Trichosporon asahii var. asahii CBS 2479]
MFPPQTILWSFLPPTLHPPNLSAPDAPQDEGSREHPRRCSARAPGLAQAVVVTRRGNAHGDGSGSEGTKKRARDDDLLRPLPQGDEIRAPESLSFEEITDPEVCCRLRIAKADALGFASNHGDGKSSACEVRVDVHVHISSLKHALFLGNVLNAQQVKEAEDEIRELPGEHDFKAKVTTKDWKRGKPQPAVGSSQPWVGIMNSNPVIERPDGTWRAIQQGAAVEPSVVSYVLEIANSQAYLYITRALKTFAPHVLGAMQLVAESYEPQELDRVGLHLYFKPDVTGWGQRGTLSVAKILETMKDKAADAETGAEPDADEKVKKADASAPGTKPEGDEQTEGAVRRSKRLKTGQEEDPKPAKGVEIAKDTGPADKEGKSKAPSSDQPGTEKPGMTVEEYEAMLDAEAADWDFPDGM